MQGTIIDRLVSRRSAGDSADMPTHSHVTRRNSHVIAAHLTPAAAQTTPTTVRGHLTPAVSHPMAETAEAGRITAPAGSVSDYTYTGQMIMTGTLSATSNQHGTWSGTLYETMTVSVDARGNGFAYEVFTGNVNLHVVNPDGTTKDSTQLFDFSVPFITLTRGHLTYSEPSFGLGGNLIATLELKGSFRGGKAAFAETLHTPFTGQVNGVLVSGALNGSSVVTTPPMTLSGTVANLEGFAAQIVKPFGNLNVTDLNSGAVTATVSVTNPKNGTLAGLAGGTYNRATGVYTITGTIGVVNHALQGLTFDPAGNLGSFGHPTNTGFTVNISDTHGAHESAVTNYSAAQPLVLKGGSSHQTTAQNTPYAPFRLVTIADTFGSEIDTVTVKLSNPKNGTLTNLAGGIYNKTTGVYLIHATAAAAQAAVRGLKFASSGTGTTGFTITVKNDAGAFVTDGTTAVTATTAEPAAIGGQSDGYVSFSYWMQGPVFTLASSATTGGDAVPASGHGVALFTQHVAAGLHRMPGHAAGIAAAHEMPGVAHAAMLASHA